MHLPLTAEFLTAAVAYLLQAPFIRSPFDVHIIRFLDLPCGNGPVCRI